LQGKRAENRKRLVASGVSWERWSKEPEVSCYGLMVNLRLCTKTHSGLWFNQHR